MGIQEFLEMGMKYKISIESKEDKYTLEIETIWLRSIPIPICLSGSRRESV